MTSAYRIFISCVSAEFRTHRTSLRNALTASRREITIQEDFQNGSGTLLEKLNHYHYIERCQSVIHLIGSSTGQKAKSAEVRWLLERYPDFAKVMPELAKWHDLNAFRFSFSQWECFLALYNRVPCFIYLAGAQSQREKDWSEDRQEVANQAQHVNRLRSLFQERRIEDFADARDVALLFLIAILLKVDKHPRIVRISCRGHRFHEGTITRSLTVRSNLANCVRCFVMTQRTECSAFMFPRIVARVRLLPSSFISFGGNLVFWPRMPSLRAHYRSPIS